MKFDVLKSIIAREPMIKIITKIGDHKGRICQARSIVEIDDKATAKRLTRLGCIDKYDPDRWKEPEPETTDDDASPTITIEDYAQLVESAIEGGIFERAGAWYKLGEVALGQTQEQVVEKLKAEPELTELLVETMVAGGLIAEKTDDD